MPGTIFQESGIQFEFSEEWVVKKYDDHRFYKYLSGRGFSGVDFISIRNGKEVVFWEMKNFLPRPGGRGHDPEQTLEDDPERFYYEISEKVKDTLLLIDTVKKYYLRKWWFRWFYRYFKNRKKPQADWIFWSQLDELIQEKGVHFILWMETKRLDAQHFAEPIQAKLLALNARIEILNRQHNPYAPSVKTS
ncbi:MAG: hypothetical protein AAFV80_05430 [Bacteroidota bacterium]